MKRRRAAQFEARFPGRFQLRAVGSGERCVFVSSRTRQDLDASIDHVLQGAAWLIDRAGVVRETKSNKPLMTVCRLNSQPNLRPGRTAGE